MIDIRKLEGVEHPNFYMSVLENLREFDKSEMEGVLSSLFNMNGREQCFYVMYLRAQRNVDTLIHLKNVAHFQAIAILSRAMFEICLDVDMLAKTADGDLRMRVYKSLELLRAARSIVKHEDKRSGQPTPSERRKYVAEMGPSIELQVRELWPGKKVTDLRHWSGLDTAQRAKTIGSETEAMYTYSYQQFSWYVHGGVQGIIDAPPEHFPRICGIALALAVVSYSRLLGAVARSMRITIHDQEFDKKLEFALGLPQAESAEDEKQLRRVVGL